MLNVAPSLTRRAARLAVRALAPFVRGYDPALDPEVAAILTLQKLLRLPAVHTMEPAAARRFAEQGMGSLDLDPAPMLRTIETTVAGRIPVHIYEPFDATPSWIVYLHGGGGVIGSVASSDPVIRFIADRTKCRVAAVEYRLGPEHRHPAAIDDACAAWDAIADRVGDDGKLVVAGDSFGGFLAAHVDLYTIAARRIRPDLQVLIYPLVDLELVSPSIARLGDGHLLTSTMMHWFRGHYLNPTDDMRAGSPRHWPTLEGSSTALVATAGFDPLVDEGDAYAAQLRAAGTKVRHRRFPELVHGFLSMAGAVRRARTAVEQLCDDIVELLCTS